jgi:hypothetical protein
MIFSGTYFDLISADNLDSSIELAMLMMGNFYVTWREKLNGEFTCTFLLLFPSLNPEG